MTALLGITIAISLADISLPKTVKRKNHLYKEKQGLFEQTKDTLDAVSVGNSHGLAFHFESLGLAGMHFWETGGDMQETLYKTRMILKQAPSIDYVFMALSPGSLSTSQEILSPDNATRRMRIKKDIPFIWDWRSFSLEDIIRSTIFDYFPVNIVQDNVYRLIGYNSSVQLISQDEKDTCFTVLDSKTGDKINISDMEDGILDGYRHALIQPACLPRFAKRKAIDTKKRVEKTIDRNPDILAENTKRLNRIAELTATAGARLVIVVPPTTKFSYYSDEIQSLVSNFEQAMSSVVEHKNVTFLDFHNLYFEKVNEHNNAYFYDGDHLAITGSSDFSEKLKDALGI